MNTSLPMDQCFSALGLSDSLCRRLRASGYSRPTPIQAQATPHVLAGADLVVHECFAAERIDRKDHADLPTLLDLAERIGLQRLALLHVSADDKPAVARAVREHRGTPELLLAQPAHTVQI